MSEHTATPYAERVGHIALGVIGRKVLYGLLGIVAIAAAVLSFAALRDLALLCGFSERLAWLLPVVVDAGAAAGSLVWLGGGVTEVARRFARALALCLLSLSVAANALSHGLEAFKIATPWWVVVIVSAIAPAVLSSIVHLAVLVRRSEAPLFDRTQVRTSIEAVEQEEVAVTDTVTRRREVTSRRSGKTAEVRAVLAELPQTDRRKNTQISRDLAREFGLSRPTVAKEVARWRPQRDKAVAA